MVHFRWLTPLLLSVLTGVIAWQTSEIRQARMDAMAYTDRIVALSSQNVNPNAVSKIEFQAVTVQIADVKSDIRDVKKEVLRISQQMWNLTKQFVVTYPTLRQKGK